MKQTFMVAALAIAAMPLMAQSAKAPKPPAPPHAYAFEADSMSGNSSYLGVEINDISGDRAQELKLKDDRGVEVTEVDQDAPAGKAGLKEHDVILGFNGTPVQSAEQFKRLMRETPAGRTVALDISRDGQPQNLKVTLADRRKYMPHIAAGSFPKVWSFESPDMAVMPPMTAMPDFPHVWNDTTITRVYRSISGVTIENLSPQLGDFFGVKNGEGMLVRSVQKGSPADAAGLHAGDVIVRVDDQKIADHSDWAEALRNAKNGKANVVIVRDKHEQTLSLAVAPRRGSDSSALNEGEDFPDIGAAMDSAADALDSVEPVVEQSATVASAEAAKALEVNQKQISKAMSESCKQAQHQLAVSRDQINREMRDAMRQASESMKAYGPELQKNVRELQKELQNIHIDVDDMQ
jgi:serine protease Do